jgi:hypothetical protein
MEELLAEEGEGACISLFGTAGWPFYRSIHMFWVQLARKTFDT